MASTPIVDVILAGRSAATRDRLERLARQAPAEIYRYHKLYPNIENKELINAALVETVLRQGHEMPENP